MTYLAVRSVPSVPRSTNKVTIVHPVEHWRVSSIPSWDQMTVQWLLIYSIGRRLSDKGSELCSLASCQVPLVLRSSVQSAHGLFLGLFNVLSSGPVRDVLGVGSWELVRLD